MVGEMSQIEPG